MQFTTLLTLLTLTSASLVAAVPGQCKPASGNSCDGKQYCCSVGLQGNIAYYCSQGPPGPEGCGTFVKVCCDKNAVGSLTPRGYTYEGCKLA